MVKIIKEEYDTNNVFMIYCTDTDGENGPSENDVSCILKFYAKDLQDAKRLAEPLIRDLEDYDGEGHGFSFKNHIFRTYSVGKYNDYFDYNPDEEPITITPNFDIIGYIFGDNEEELW